MKVAEIFLPSFKFKKSNGWLPKSFFIILLLLFFFPNFIPFLYKQPSFGISILSAPSDHGMSILLVAVLVCFVS